MIRKPRLTSKKEAAIKQIHASIKHLKRGEFECSITLACAAEGLMNDPNPRNVWELLKFVSRSDGRTEKEFVNLMNETRDWLKHPTPIINEVRFISDDEALMALLRAVLKFRSIYKESSPEMNGCMKQAVARGYMDEDIHSKLPTPTPFVPTSDRPMFGKP